MGRYRAANICTTEEHLHDIVAAYQGFDEFVFDVETRGAYRARPERNEVAWLGLAGPGRTDVIPMGHINGRTVTKAKEERRMLRNLDGTPLRTAEGKRQFETTRYPAVFTKPPQQLWPSVVFEALRPIFFSDKTKIGHNVKFDLGSIAKYYGGEVPPLPYGDTLILVHLIKETLGALKLDYVINKVYGLQYADGKLGKTGIDFYDFWQVAKYQRLDVFYTWLLWTDYKEQLDKQELRKCWNVEMELVRSLVFMEAEGAPVDTKTMGEISHRIDDRVAQLQERLYKDAGKVWNLDNPIEKGWFVYDVRKNEPKFFTPKKHQRSTTSEHLASYARRDKSVAALAEYAELAKLKGTYIDGLGKHLIEGRLHPSFLAAGTTTGRFSCADPNLQNLPRDTDERAEYSIRSLFVAPDDKHMLVVADYSQIEYRLFAHFSRDPYMIEMFEKGFDAHTAMASMVLQKNPEDLSPEERTVYGKTVNFALGFGAGANRLAAGAKITKSAAQEILDKHEEASPSFYSWKRRVIREAKKRRPPYVTTLLGRRRRLPELFADDEGVRWHAERQAINTRVQGSAADIIKIGMVRLQRRVEGTPIRPILTVHDELVSIVPKGLEDEAVAHVREAMEGAVILRVPLIADIKVVDRWSEGKG